jgi:D-alanyl-D-alanine carboxypeptidase/D-alanyl-D-alanine-endopeptidase (penicillin-binding protein 4)
MTVRTSLSIAVGFVLLLLNTSCKSTRHVPVETKVAPKPVLTIIPQPKPIDTLAVAIDSLIRLLPQGSEVGVSVYNLTKDRPLYAYRDKKLSRPASTMKLITTITTLSYPEGSKAFSTEVWHTGKIVNDTLQGDIFVRGGMDPEFDNDAMNSLVAQTAKFPFKVLNGHIIGDVSMKDSLYWGLGWMWDDAPYDYQPHLTPLMLHKGLVTVTARPDSIGKPAIVTAFPASDYYTLVNETKSKTADAGSFSVTRDYVGQSNAILIKGNVTRPCSRDITLSYGQNYFMQTFTSRLQKDGGKTLLQPYSIAYNKPVDYKTTTRMAICLTDYQTVIKQMLKQSDNLNAEAMFYRLGEIACEGSHPATADDAVRAIRKLINSFGLNANNYNLADGSGLSNYDYLTPELEVAFLRYAYEHPHIYNTLYPSMPIAGTDGTLRNRMKDSLTVGNVHAKTGSYTAINALAGYLTNAAGDKIAFSIMNQNILNENAARKFQDEVCRLLCRDRRQ